MLNENLNFPRKLQEVEVEVIGAEACRAAMRPFTIDDAEICVMMPGTPKTPATATAAVRSSFPPTMRAVMRRSAW